MVSGFRVLGSIRFKGLIGQGVRACRGQKADGVCRVSTV